jgi:hypothetical protein
LLVNYIWCGLGTKLTLIDQHVQSGNLLVLALDSLL